MRGNNEDEIIIRRPPHRRVAEEATNGRTLRSERKNCGSNPCGVTEKGFILLSYFHGENSEGKNCSDNRAGY